MEIRTIFIMATYNCNLNCSYCYEPVKIRRTINVERLKKQLANEFAKEEFDGFTLTFHGGEPFLAFAEIREICEWAWETYPDLELRCKVATNGTVLTDRIREWLTANRHRFSVGLSLDGKEATHNRNRCGSFKLIDMPFFQSLGTVTVKMTVSPEAAAEMFDNFLFLEELGFAASPTPAQEVEWSRDALDTYRRQIKLLADWQLANPERELLTVFRTKLDKFSDRSGESRWNCGAGYYEIAYDIDGNRRLCHAFVSNFASHEDDEKVAKILQESSAEKELAACSDCRLKRACAPCIGLNYVRRGSIDVVQPSFCALVKIGMEATAYLYARAMSDPRSYCWMRELSPVRLGIISQGIKHVFEL